MKNKGQIKSGVSSLKRVVKDLFSFYPVLVPLTALCIVFSSIVSSIPALFIQKVITVIEGFVKSGDWDAARPQIMHYVLLLVVLYVLSLISMFTYNQLMAVITQGFLNKMRVRMFSGMQKLPISYFDSHKKGDIMSHYTNDIDALRQLVSQTLPALLQSGMIITVVLAIMLYFSVWLTLVVLIGVFCMILISKKIGGGSTKFFVRQQKSLGAIEGYLQEMINGQRVIKVFNHESKVMEGFDVLNDTLRKDAFSANAYANMLGPIIMNIGNILYVLIAFVGGSLMLAGVPNISVSGMAFGVSILIPYLNMTKQFTGNVNNLSQQVNAIAMASAGAQRVFDLMDEKPESDDGYVVLVNAVIDAYGNISESEERTGVWAWKHRHGDGTVTYTKLSGDVRFFDVDFSYDGKKKVLNDITLYAEPGQKVAFVGATGAGKTTITNLINRFYDIEDGKIRYDGININKIRKADLRHSLGLVLQDTNLFTGTVLDNIRYGRLDATEEECHEAARLVGADEFISRLPQGYDTMLLNNGNNLSQGQRQLISIARAAVADPPVMILDEATSSIDTRTENIVSRGMDKLMENRTVFVIAHRLSTVHNSDVIMVLENGEIIERGDHAKLMAEKGTYYNLYTGAFELE